MAEEKTFELKVRKLLRSCGAWELKTWSNGTQRTGVPDILCCIHGYFLAIEVKASNGRPSDLQLKELHDIDAAGGLALLLYPKDYSMFCEFIGLFTDAMTPLPALAMYDGMKQKWKIKYERMMNDDAT